MNSNGKVRWCVFFFFFVWQKEMWIKEMKREMRNEMNRTELNWRKKITSKSRKIFWFWEFVVVDNDDGFLTV